MELPRGEEQLGETEWWCDEEAMQELSPPARLAIPRVLCDVSPRSLELRNYVYQAFALLDAGKTLKRMGAPPGMSRDALLRVIEQRFIRQHDEEAAEPLLAPLRAAAEPLLAEPLRAVAGCPRFNKQLAAVARQPLSSSQTGFEVTGLRVDDITAGGWRQKIADACGLDHEPLLREYCARAFARMSKDRVLCILGSTKIGGDVTLGKLVLCLPQTCSLLDAWASATPLSDAKVAWLDGSGRLQLERFIALSGETMFAAHAECKERGVMLLCAHTMARVRQLMDTHPPDPIAPTVVAVEATTAVAKKPRRGRPRGTKQYTGVDIAAAAWRLSGLEQSKRKRFMDMFACLCPYDQQSWMHDAMSFRGGDEVPGDWIVKGTRMVPFVPPPQDMAPPPPPQDMAMDFAPQDMARLNEQLDFAPQDMARLNEQLDFASAVLVDAPFSFAQALQQSPPPAAESAVAEYAGAAETTTETFASWENWDELEW